MAEFWDNHDLADYWKDEFRPADVQFAQKLSGVIAVPLDAASLARLRAEAKRKGVGEVALAREWVLEHLRAGG